MRIARLAPALRVISRLVLRLAPLSSILASGIKICFLSPFTRFQAIARIVMTRAYLAFLWPFLTYFPPFPLITGIAPAAPLGLLLTNFAIPFLPAGTLSPPFLAPLPPPLPFPLAPLASQLQPPTQSILLLALRVAIPCSPLAPGPLSTLLAFRAMLPYLYYQLPPSLLSALQRHPPLPSPFPLTTTSRFLAASLVQGPILLAAFTLLSPTLALPSPWLLLA